MREIVRLNPTSTLVGMSEAEVSSASQSMTTFRLREAMNPVM